MHSHILTYSRPRKREYLMVLGYQVGGGGGGGGRGGASFLCVSGITLRVSRGVEGGGGGGGIEHGVAS